MLETRGMKLPFITTLHGTDITLVGLDRSYLPITRLGIDQSDGVTAISDYLKQRTVEAFGVTREIEVIRNFVNCDYYVRNRRLLCRAAPALRRSRMKRSSCISRTSAPSNAWPMSSASSRASRRPCPPA